MVPYQIKFEMFYLSYKYTSINYLDEYYSKIPKYEKDQVEFIATDMYEPYRRIIRKHFKHSLHVVDPLCKALHKRSYVKQIFM